MLIITQANKGFYYPCALAFVDVLLFSVIESSAFIKASRWGETEGRRCRPRLYYAKN